MAGRAGTTGKGRMPEMGQGPMPQAVAEVAVAAVVMGQGPMPQAVAEVAVAAAVAAVERRRRVAAVCHVAVQWVVLAKVLAERQSRWAVLIRRAPRHHEGFHRTGGSAETAITSPTSGTS